MTLNKKYKTLLFYFTTLFLLLGIAQLISSFYGYQLRLYIKLYGVRSSTDGYLYQLDWDVLWYVNHGWSLGITAILSAFLIYRKKIFAWSFCVASSTLLLFSSIYTLYQFSKNIMQYSDYDFKFMSLFLPYKFFMMAISIFGLLLLFSKGVLNRIPNHVSRYYLAFGMAVVLITLVYFV